MKTLKVTKCKGDGQGECRRCKELTGFGLNWTSFLYRVEGYDGLYCGSCVKALEQEAKDEK